MFQVGILVFGFSPFYLFQSIATAPTMAATRATAGPLTVAAAAVATAATDDVVLAAAVTDLVEGTTTVVGAFVMDEITVPETVTCTTEFCVTVAASPMV